LNPNPAGNTYRLSHGYLKYRLNERKRLPLKRQGPQPSRGRRSPIFEQTLELEPIRPDSQEDSRFAANDKVLSVSGFRKRQRIGGT
jgi:hypothetical protein